MAQQRRIQRPLQLLRRHRKLSALRVRAVLIARRYNPPNQMLADDPQHRRPLRATLRLRSVPRRPRRAMSRHRSVHHRRRVTAHHPLRYLRVLRMRAKTYRSKPKLTNEAAIRGRLIFCRVICRAQPFAAVEQLRLGHLLSSLPPLAPN